MINMKIIKHNKKINNFKIQIFRKIKTILKNFYKMLIINNYFKIKLRINLLKRIIMKMMTMKINKLFKSLRIKFMKNFRRKARMRKIQIIIILDKYHPLYS